MKIPYPRQVVLVSSRAEAEVMGKRQEKQDIITLSWSMPVSFQPELYAIAVGKQRFSYRLIKESGVFCVNFMPYELKDKALFCGRNTGEHMDKFSESGFTPEECEKIHCPRIKEALAFMECEVKDEIEAGDHAIFIGEVMKSAEKKKGKRLFHLGGDRFTTTEE